MLKRASPDRLSMFSDGIFAVLITVLVLELRPPEAPTYAALLALWPHWLSYGVSYVFIAIVWTNHHYLLRYADEATPRPLVVQLCASLLDCIAAGVDSLDGNKRAGAGACLLLCNRLLVNVTYVALIWELVETSPGAEASATARKAMRWRSVIALFLFGAAGAIALWRPLGGLAICILCLTVYLKPDPIGAARKRT